jgi:endoglucanase
MRFSTRISAIAMVVLAIGGGVDVSAAAAPTGDAVSPGPVFPGPLYLEAGTDAAKAQQRLLAEGSTESAALIGRIASQPTAVWLGDWWSEDLMRSVLRRHVAAAAAQGATLVFVTYAIPFRDCGGHSAGGTTYDGYLDWNRVIAQELAGTHAVVLVEPDSLASLSSTKCAGEVVARPPLIAAAVDILADAGLVTYLDGGNARWLTPAVQADWLKRAGIARANGFFTNVSNFSTTQAEADYAGKVSSRVGWKHYVIDVSRNGRGWTGTWCNPAGAGLGVAPRSTEGAGKMDALLWVKHPGASDGPCTGGPAAGAWFESGALELARNRVG